MAADTPPHVERPTGNVARWLERKWGWPEGSLLGAADVARHLGVTRQRVSQLKRDDRTFPAPGIGAHGLRFWRRAGIEAWAAMHRPARTGAGGRFTGEAAALLLAAEGIAGEAGHWWVDAGHVWAAVCRGAGGEALTATVASLGITDEEAMALLTTMRGTGERVHPTLAFTPRAQTFLSSADRRAREADRAAVTCVDILLAFVEAPRQRDLAGRKRPDEHLLDLLERRGLDIAQLRERLLAVEADPSMAESFEPRRLRRPRKPRARPMLRGVQLAPNPLGHDPRTAQPWGAAFGRTRDDRSLVVDGEQWFFTIDGDGFFIRTVDGRPVGYRYRIRPKPRLRPVNGFCEVLPMPPVELAEWPDKRFGGER